MKLAYTCHDIFPSPDTNTQQIFWSAVEVARLGHSVDLMIPAISGDVAGHYGAADALPSAFRVVPVHRRAAMHPPAQAWFDWRVPSRLGRQSFDLVWTRDPVAALSAAQAGRPVVFESYRPDYATLRRFAIWRRLCLRHRNLRGVVAHSRLAADAFMTAGIDGNRCLVAHNGFAPSLMEPRVSREEARIWLELPPEGPLVVYAGHVGRRKGTEHLVALASRLPDVRFLILGVDPGSSDHRAFERLLHASGVRNVIVRPRVQVSRVAPYLYAADCLIVPPTDEPLRRYRRTVLPIKIFSYLAAGRPILAPRLPDFEEVLTDGQTARLVPPNDVPAAADALRRLLSDPGEQQRLSVSAFQASERYTWAARARTLVTFFERIHAGADRSTRAAATSSRR